MPNGGGASGRPRRSHAPVPDSARAAPEGAIPGGTGLGFAGRNAETVAHLRENGGSPLMWCAFQGPPNIVRIHGRGEPVFRDAPAGRSCLPISRPSAPRPHRLRAIIVVRAELIRDTCGYGVPLMTYDSDRDLHAKRFAREDDESLSRYLENKDHIATSLDGLPGLPLPLPPTPGTAGLGSRD